MRIILSAIAFLMISAACSHKTTETKPETNVIEKTQTGVVIGFRNSGPANALPKATAFRMNGDYADNVAVTLNSDGSLAYFPAPSDISSASRPIDLGNGWWLNRQGISSNSVFTKYTFAEYSKLKSTPSIEQLKTSVIPGARVVEMRRLPYSINEAPEHLDAIRELLK